MRPCYIFDLDGTLADLTHRLHHIMTPGKPKDWDSFFDGHTVLKDTPILHMVKLYELVRYGDGPWTYHKTIIVSGRSDVCRRATEDWLDLCDIKYDALYMRKAGDRRPDYLVKYDLLQQLKADGWDPIMAFDDRDQVVKMWRENGIPCAQVAPGDF